ncbi:MAG: aspartate--ammonia ligase [Candidatus Aphodomorpha sp.]|nr:aspartate--ammonia ligase [bacterium]
METRIPTGYSSKLGLYETQSAITLIKSTFQDALAAVLNLKRVSAPLFVNPAAGLNDNLNGYERPVCFDIPAAGVDAEVVHSLAKWKRFALHRYGFHPGRGLYTDMNAIRRDEQLDNLHSVYVDQWDWEKVITREERGEALLKRTVQSIVEAIGYTLAVVQAKYPVLSLQIKRDVTFITSQELLDLYPGKSAKEREQLFAREHGTVFIMQIGDKLSDGEPHDGRAPDYDDWSLNGDILFYYPLLDCAFEISSMGIRVDEASLAAQLKKAGCEERAALPFHRALLNGELPLTIGGGIGQSRLCMMMLEKAHIGEVQSSIWDAATLEACSKAGVTLL